MDGFLVTATVGRRFHFLYGKGMARVPFLGPALKIAGAIPIRRSENTGYDEQNAEQREMLKTLDQYKADMREAALSKYGTGVARARALKLLRSMGYID